MNPMEMTTSLLFIFAYFFIASFGFFLLRQLLLSRGALAKGPLYHPRGWLHYIAWWFRGICTVYVGRRDTALVVLVLSLLSVEMATVPLYSPDRLFYGLPETAFLLIYFLCRLVWTILVNRREEFLAEGKKDHILTAAIILLIVFGILGFAKGGTPVFAFYRLTPSLLNKPSCLLLFLLLFVSSNHFFLPLDKKADVGIMQWPHYISRAVWFFVLSWIFIGPVARDFAGNYVFFVLLSTALNVLFDVVAASFPLIGASLQADVDERYLLPAIAGASLLIYMEILFF